jgi:light-regulated signal transduction histidine kinase (bacteriophytochrome)
MTETSLTNTRETVDLMKMVRVSLETIRKMVACGAGNDSGPQIEQLENLEQLLLDQEARLNAFDKVLEEFNYSIAHELCAPLRRITGFTREIKHRFADAIDPEGNQVLDNILVSSQQMDDLIESLMQVSRLSHIDLQMESLDLSAMAGEIAEEIKKTAEGRKGEFEIGGGLTARGDRFLVRTALRHLLDNAWKFTVRKEAALIQFGVFEVDGKPVFYVRDNGVGFDVAEGTRLFHPFQRLHESGGCHGRGIGLTIVKKIIERHGGQIWAEGATDQGATFYFTL